MNAGKHDDGRFAALVEANRAKFPKICRAYAWNQAGQEDLHQEMLFQIWRGLPGLKDAAFASTWIYRAPLNTAISFVRKHRNRSAKDRDDATVTGFREADFKQVTVEIALLRSVLWWYILPLTIGGDIFFLGLRESFTTKVAWLIGSALFEVFLWWINQYAVKKSLLPLREKLEALLKVE